MAGNLLILLLRFARKWHSLVRGGLSGFYDLSVSGGAAVHHALSYRRVLSRVVKHGSLGHVSVFSRRQVDLLSRICDKLYHVRTVALRAQCTAALRTRSQIDKIQAHKENNTKTHSPIMLTDVFCVFRVKPMKMFSGFARVFCLFARLLLRCGALSSRGATVCSPKKKTLSQRDDLY